MNKADFRRQSPTTSAEQQPSSRPPSSQPPSSRPRRTLRQEIRRRLILAFVAFVLYVLSVGPMYWVYYDAKYNTGVAIIAAFYEPLFLLCGWMPWLATVVDAYVMLWIA